MLTGMNILFRLVGGAVGPVVSHVFLDATKIIVVVFNSDASSPEVYSSRKIGLT